MEISVTSRPKVSGLVRSADGEDAVQLRLERADHVLRQNGQRLAADIVGEVGAAENRAERHEEDREGKEREDQREGDGARHHDAVVAEEAVGRVVQDGPDRPEPARRGERIPAGAGCAVSLGSKLDIGHAPDSNGSRRPSASPI